MARIYVRRIKAGLMTLEEVPVLWSEQVQQLMQVGGKP